MALLTNVAILLVVACFSHHVMVGSCQRGHGKRGRTGPKAGRQPKSGSARPIKGKLLTRDKAECSWVATGEDPVILNITCKKADGILRCEYAARPGSCPQYASNGDLYWKQISRALKKQRSLCGGRSALVKAGVCRKAPQSAHFRLQVAQKKETFSPFVPPVTAEAVKSCRPANRKLAGEFCKASWTSLCTFLFTMVKDYDC
ncbi:fibroblast growth factor-binding protein 1 [Menidia menidia]